MQLAIHVLTAAEHAVEAWEAAVSARDSEPALWLSWRPPMSVAIGGATDEVAEGGSHEGRLQGVMGDAHQSPSAAATFRFGRGAERSQGDA